MGVRPFSRACYTVRFELFNVYQKKLFEKNSI